MSSDIPFIKNIQLCVVWSLDCQLMVMSGAGQWSQGSGRWSTVAAGARWAAPLCAAPGALSARPLRRGARPPAQPAHADWRAARADTLLLHCECRAPPLDVYRSVPHAPCPMRTPILKLECVYVRYATNSKLLADCGEIKYSTCDHEKNIIFSSKIV